MCSFRFGFKPHVRSTFSMIPKKLNALADLPNKSGFEFTGLTKTGELIACVTEKYSEGYYTVYKLGTNERVFQLLMGWYCERPK